MSVIHSFKIQRCNSPSNTSGSEEPGSDVLEYLTNHFHEGGDIGERGEKEAKVTWEGERGDPPITSRRGDHRS
jgi:hypothetical protein